MIPAHLSCAVLQESPGILQVLVGSGWEGTGVAAAAPCWLNFELCWWDFGTAWICSQVFMCQCLLKGIFQPHISQTPWGRSLLGSLVPDPSTGHIPDSLRLQDLLQIVPQVLPEAFVLLLPC